MNNIKENTYKEIEIDLGLIFNIFFNSKTLIVLITLFCLVISSISFNAIAIVDSKAGIKWWALIWWNGVASKGVLKEVNNGLFKELFF